MAIEGIAASDFKGLNTLKLKAQANAQEALPAVAKQFEAIFLQSMLKSMRMGEHFLDDNSPFKGKSEETFRDMLDTQYVSNISDGRGRGIGLAAMLTQQLQQQANAEPADKPEMKGLNTQAKPEFNALNLPARPANPAAEINYMSYVPPAPESAEASKTIAGIDDFVKSIWPYARQAASVLGLDPKILMAQAALETGWGQHVAKDADGSSSNNLFNIKTGQSNHDSVKVKTREYIANTPIQMTADFRKYPSVAHSFNDYINLLKGSDRYQTALANADDPDNFVGALHDAGYATDPNYARKILSIYHGDQLQQAMQRTGISE